MADSTLENNDSKAQEPVVNGEEVAQSTEEQVDAPAPDVFSVNVKLPRAPYQTKIIVTTQEQIQDVRQSIIDTPETYQYSCFHLEHDGTRINDYIELSEVPGITPDSELVLVEDPYTEKEAKLHFLRVRELIGASSPKIDTTSGIDHGLSLFPSIVVEGDGKKKHSMSDFKFDDAAELDCLTLPASAPGPKTVRNISVSHWNPPPYNLRQRGHIMYLQVGTLEGDLIHITSHISGFYVNKSTNSKFDPAPRAGKSHHSHSLLNLLHEISPQFTKEFQAWQEYSALREPLVTYPPTNAIPASPWIVSPESATLASHPADIVRTQDSFLISGTENVDSLRDFNEEFQSTRELPKETIQERVFRERLLSKLFADYTEAAVRGAVLIARGEIAPLNPTEGRDAQIYVYNNIFFSHGADGVGTFANEGGDEAAYVATGKDVLGVKYVNGLDIQGLSTPGTVIVDYLGRRIVAQSIVPGIFRQREDGQNQIDYGGVEGRDVVAENEEFVPVFEKMSKAMRVKAHSVWDKEGKKHDLVTSVETKGLVGTDGRKYVLDLYRITPLDVAFIEEHWKGVEGKETENGYPHRMTVLRPELVESFWRSKVREYVTAELAKKAEKKAAEKPAEIEGEKKETEETKEGETKTEDTKEGESTAVEKSEGETAEKPAEEEEQEQVDISKFDFALNPDVFSGQEPQTEEEKAQMEKDEADVREACAYLTDKVIPALVEDLKEGETGLPMDGASLVKLMHKRGINARYLGKIATLATEAGSKLDAIRTLAIQEMIARSSKHILNPLLRDIPLPVIPYAASHFLNCLLGSQYNPKPKAEKDEELWKVFNGENFAFEKLTPESLRAQIEKDVFKRFRFTLPETWAKDIKHIQLLREIALKQGFQLGARKYHFVKPAKEEKPKEQKPKEKEVAKPKTNGTTKHSKKKSRAASPTEHVEAKLPDTTFTQADILNVVPLVKDASSRSLLAEEALEAGKISIFAQNQRETGQELLLESLSLHEQIYGILHPDVARVYASLAMIYYQLDEKAAAVELGRKAVVVSERTVGIDSSETLLNYLNLGLFEHTNGNTEGALAYIRHAFNLWRIVFGDGHPDSVTSMNNVAVMLQALKHYHDSRLWFEASLKVCEGIFGKSSPNTATLSFQLAQALALDNDSKGAVTRMRDAFNVFLAELGPNDRNTKEAENWLEQLTHNAVSIAKQAKVMQSNKMRRINLAPHVTMGTRPQAQAEGTGAEPTVPAGAPGAMDSRSIEELMKFIEGAGADQSGSKKKRPTKANPRKRGGKM